MSVSDTLDGAFKGLRATFLPSALAVVILLAPLLVLMNLVASQIAPEAFGGLPALFEEFDQVNAQEPDVVQDLLFSAVTFLGSFIELLLMAVVGSVVVALVLQVDRGEKADFGTAFRSALPVIARTLGMAVLILLTFGVVGFVGILALVAVLVVEAFIGVILLLVIGLPVAFAMIVLATGLLMLVPSVTVVEQRGVMDSLKRVLWVLRRRFWRVVGIGLLLFLLDMAISGALGLPFFLLSGFVGGFGWAVVSVGNVLASAVMLPVQILAMLLIYLDARARFEGFDLQLRNRWHAT